MSEPFREGEDVLLYLDAKRKYLTSIQAGRQLHTHRGFIQLSEIVGKRPGESVLSSMRETFVVFRPNIRDYLMKLPRMTQVMYPKDIGLILVYANIQPGSRVVEAGVGSGMLTAVLASHVKPTGRVYGYEINEAFLSNASRNLARLGLDPYVELKNTDVLEGVKEEDVDAVVLDLATPWLVVPYASAALKGGGTLASFSPTINQVEKTVQALTETGFVEVETVELILRNFKVKTGETRPVTLMIGHTGYLVFARKTFLREHDKGREDRSTSQGTVGGERPQGDLSRY
ncbi:MAG: tRNA (adenine-N1)-methyltransferase [Candidatus Bathyarchaeia archaeon]